MTSEVERLRAELRGLRKPRSREEVADYVRKVLENPLVQEAERWYERAGAGEDSRARHQKNGKYLPGRKKLHDRIVKARLNAGAENGDEPVAVFLMGMPGSGKTTNLLPAVKVDFKGVAFTTINPDEVKPLLAEDYQGIQAPYYHEESSHVAKFLLAREAVARSHNVIFDEVGRNADSMLDRVGILTREGYEVHVRYAHVPTHVSVGRVVERFARDGRWVPLDYILDGLEEDVEATFFSLEESGMPASAVRKETG